MQREFVEVVQRVMEWEKTGSEGFYKGKSEEGLLSGQDISHVESYMAVIILKLAVCSRDNYCTQFWGPWRWAR